MCKFDNSVQIAHNVSIGKGCLLTAHVTIAGSTKLESFVALVVKQVRLIIFQLEIAQYWPVTQWL
ncbi:MAG: hypothetical protein Ct9H300mP29_4490 [Candidatus Neomarinimicrobiota bacterium]|nr:MAG: hypothetical protein Ct9H300mP29_4490 [Candidatus Neomarinimicrobiota bacterium]